MVFVHTHAQLFIFVKFLDLIEYQKFPKNQIQKH